jgi:hypothetical protein
MGLPCVAFINTQNPGHTHFHQTIKQFQDGIVANNLKELEISLDTLINDRKKRLELGLGAYSRVSQDFNAAWVVLRYIDAIKAAIANKLNEDNDDEQGPVKESCKQVCGGSEHHKVEP